MIKPKVISAIHLDQTPKNSIRYYWLELITNSFGSSVHLPIIVARGNSDDKVLGLTAAVHGNELNGIQVIQRLFAEIDINELEGIIVAVPVVNIPAFERKKRRFNDGTDLNHIMPGVVDGNVSQVYAHRFFSKVVSKFDYLLDLHTASFGRVNSYYIRADLSNDITKKLALLQNAQIIVDNAPSDGTLRGAAAEIGIPSITLEVGNPHVFQRKIIKSGIEGIHNTLSFLGFTNDIIEKAEQPSILCKTSYWIYTDHGGLLSVKPNLVDHIQKGEVIAVTRDIFGFVQNEFLAPENGVVIGKSIDPVNQSGGRILHLGIEK